MARRHTRNPSDAEDAVQEIFLAIWKNASRFDRSRASEPAFITMLARRRLIDLYRGRKRRPDLEGAEAELETMSDGRPMIAEARTEAGLAARAIERLDPKEREVVLMSTYHGYSHSEISDLTGLPLGTVKTYIRRGLIRVREALGKRPETQLQGATT